MALTTAQIEHAPGARRIRTREHLLQPLGTQGDSLVPAPALPASLTGLLVEGIVGMRLRHRCRKAGCSMPGLSVIASRPVRIVLHQMRDASRLAMYWNWTSWNCWIRSGKAWTWAKSALPK